MHNAYIKLEKIGPNST